MPDLTRLLTLVTSFDPPSDEDSRSRGLTLELLNRTPDPFHRTTFDPGHITGSGIVVSGDTTRVLVVHHRRLDRWLQPGGHVELFDRDTAGTAAREIREETGVTVAAEPAPLLGIDVHEIPAARGEPTHFHYDICHRFRASAERVHVADEIVDASWWTLSEIVERSADATLVRYARRALGWERAAFPAP